MPAGPGYKLRGDPIPRNRFTYIIALPPASREVTLDIAWMIAGAVTERYRAAGYFLSRAYVPQQKILDGQLRIEVVEGYIAKVDFKR